MTESGYLKGKRAVGRSVTVQAPAKVNLHLEVLRQRHYFVPAWIPPRTRNRPRSRTRFPVP